MESHKLKALIVDDEPLAREVLRNFLQSIPGIITLGEASYAGQALQLLEKHDPDIIFMDVEMPGINGLDLVKSLGNSAAIIFVTAYPQYAVEGFELDATDYLVKPFSFSRLTEAVKRAEKRLATKKAPPPVPSPAYISLKVDKRLIKVDTKAIKYFQGSGDFVKVVAEGKTMIISEKLKALEERLPSPPFLRIHKSYLINLDLIEYLEGNFVKMGNEDIPVGAAYKDQLRSTLGDPGLSS